MDDRNAVLSSAMRVGLVLEKSNKFFADATKAFGDVYKKAMSAGYMVKELNKIAKIKTDLDGKAFKENIRFQELMAKKMMGVQDAQLEKDIAASIAKRNLIKEEAKLAASLQEPLIAKRLKVAKKYKEMMGEDSDRAMFTPRKAEEFGEEIASAFGDATSRDPKMMAGVIGKLGKLAKAFGEKAEGSSMGVKGGALETLGKSLGGIAKGLLMIGAIVGGIAALAKVLLDADSAAKELNRTMFESGISGADLADKFGGVSDNIDKVRKSFTEAVHYNIMWGVTAKDTLAILGSFAEAGFTYKEITDGAKNATEETEHLQKATEGAIAYSKILGMSSSEVATNMATYMEEFGLTLKGIEERFSAITLVAKDSGFATKRFFNMVLQATSGMSMYNVRIEEAVELLVKLGRTLGEKKGADALTKVMQGSREKSTQERTKDVMTTGLPLVLDTLQKDAANKVAELSRRITSLGETQLDSAKEFWDVVGRGIKKSGAEAAEMGKNNPGKLSQALASIPEARQKIMLTDALHANPALGRMLRDTLTESLAHRGTLGAATAASQVAGPGADLFLSFNRLAEVIHKSVDDIQRDDIVQNQNWEAQMGLTGQAAEDFRAQALEWAGTNDLLKAEQEKIKKMSPDDRYKESLEFNLKYAKGFGVMLDESGNRFKAIADSSLEGMHKGEQMADTVQDLLLHMGDAAKEPEAAPVGEDILRAREIADHTKDIAQMMDVGVAKVLEDIFKVVTSIKNAIGFGPDKEKKQMRQEAKASLEHDIADYNKKIKKEQDLSAAATAILKNPRATEDQKKQAAATIKEAGTNIPAYQEMIRKTRGAMGTAAEMDEDTYNSADNLKYRSLNADRLKDENERLRLEVKLKSQQEDLRYFVGLKAGGVKVNDEMMDAAVAAPGETEKELEEVNKKLAKETANPIVRAVNILKAQDKKQHDDDERKANGIRRKSLMLQILAASKGKLKDAELDELMTKIESGQAIPEKDRPYIKPVALANPDYFGDKPKALEGLFNEDNGRTNQRVGGPEGGGIPTAPNVGKGGSGGTNTVVIHQYGSTTGTAATVGRFFDAVR